MEASGRITILKTKHIFFTKADTTSAKSLTLKRRILHVIYCFINFNRFLYCNNVCRVVEVKNGTPTSNSVNKYIS